MNFWRRDIKGEPELTRADVIIQKKRRKQDPQAKGLKAVAIPRIGHRRVHQRNEDRHFLNGTYATAIIGKKKHQVEVLNLSSNGIMVGLSVALEIGQAVRIAIEECAPITASVRWIQTGRVGLEFAAETVIIAEAGVQDFIIETIRREKANESYKPDFTVAAEQRGVEKRHQLVWVGKLCWQDRDATARLRNISRTGAMIAMSEAVGLKSGDEVELRLHESEPVAARVCWNAGDQLGLEFTEDFDVSRLVAIACAELAHDDEIDDEESASLADNATIETDTQDDDFTSLRVRLASKGDCSPKPGRNYSRLSLDEVYKMVHPETRPQEEAVETKRASG